jgi:phosphonate transport system substrate-binding protein
MTSENEADRQKRYGPVADYLGRLFGERAVIRQATDYAGVVEAMRSAQIELAYFGPAGYARAWLVTNGNVEPLVSPVDNYGDYGMNSILVVLASRPWKTLEDVRGRSLALADPNSTTGYQAPWFYLRKQGIEMSKYFGKLAFSGSHETSILGLLAGTYEVAATWQSNAERGNIQRMERKKLIPSGQTRIVWQSPRVPVSVWTVRSDMPSDRKRILRDGLLRMPRQAPEAWRALTDGEERELRLVTHQDYADVVEMIRANLAERKPQA